MRYPQIEIRSKNELAKRISGSDLTYTSALELINDVLDKYDEYWHDSSESKPEEDKYVRSAVGTRLGRLLKLIDKRVLRPHDRLVPDFIFGGLSGRNHIQAVHSLLGKRRDRTLLGLDITHFFEQISEKRVFYLFRRKFGCTAKAAKLFARICCVPSGPKGTERTSKILARGFATSTRLALWCNLDTFLQLKWRAQRLLQKHDPKIALFVDDIGITASRVSEDQMKKVAKVIKNILLEYDTNQPLPLNQRKKKIRRFADGAEQLGIKLGRNKMAIGSKARAKRDKIRYELRKPISQVRKTKLIQQRRSYYQYEKQLSVVESKGATKEW